MVHFSSMLEKGTNPRFANLLLAWYKENARNLPWRRTTDPYQIWVSEIMLQQTRVETVIPYYQRWMDRFPTLEDLAQAEQDEILKCWEGLGYYHRATNLHQAVKEVVSNYGGNLPDDPEILQQLPGIGRYTAGAISSIAFNQVAPILDGNVRRVFTRYFNISTPLGTTETECELWKIAEELIHTEDPGTFNQALMELGALVCLPRNPLCQGCPLEADCAARQLGIQDLRPVRKGKSPLPHYHVTAAVCLSNDRVLLTKRPLKGLLGGMWEYPGGKQEDGESLEETLQREIREELSAEIEIGDLLGVYKQAYTHYKVTLHAFQCQLNTKNLVLNYHTDSAWVKIPSLADYPMGKIDRQISGQLEMTYPKRS